MTDPLYVCTTVYYKTQAGVKISAGVYVDPAVRNHGAKQISQNWLCVCEIHAAKGALCETIINHSLTILNNKSAGAANSD